MGLRAVILLGALLVAHSGVAAQHATRKSQPTVYKGGTPITPTTSGPDGRPTNFDRPCNSLPDGVGFAEKACYLKVPYRPDLVRTPTFQSPACDTTTSLTSNQIAALAAAYQKAPPYAQSRLCRLTKFFIIPQSAAAPQWGSWGLWVPPPKAPDVYIAISEDRVPPAGSPAINSAAAAENDILRGLVPALNTWEQSGQQPPPPTYTSTGPSEIGLLSVIAHELGHVSLADANADQQTPPRPGQSKACFQNTFIASSWTGFSKRKWVAFGTDNNSKHKDTNTPTNKDIDGFIGRGLRRIASQAFSDVGGRHFASLFAALSPEEDFVETYKYRVYIDAGSTTLTLNFPQVADPRDMLAPLQGPMPETPPGPVPRNQVLLDKVTCLTDLGVFKPIQ